MALLVLLLLTPHAQAATIAWWKFEPGALTVDSSGNGHTLANTGVTSSTEVMSQAAGISSGAAAFNGTASLRSAQALDLSSYQQLTIEFFFKSTSITAGQILFETGTNYNSQGGIVAYIDKGNLDGSARPDGGGDYSMTRIALDATWVNRWVHFAYQINLDANTGDTFIQLFVNGVKTGSVVRFRENVTSFPDDYLLNIGARNGGNLFFTGLMDELRISDRILAPEQFLYAQGIPEPSSLFLAGGGLLAAALWRRRRARNISQE